MELNTQIVSRKLWMAQDRDSTIDAENTLIHPVEKVIILDTKTEYSDSAEVNSALVKFLESTDRIIHERHDIRYNFLIGGDGQIYEGCGWDVRGNYTTDCNDRSIGVGFIGNFDVNKLNSVQLRNLQVLIDDGVNANKIQKDCAIKRLSKGELKDIDISCDD